MLKPTYIFIVFVLSYFYVIVVLKFLSDTFKLQIKFYSYCLQLVCKQFY